MYALHFTPKELGCKHCGEDKTTERLRMALDALRAAVGRKIIVHDAYRCATHNAAVEGAAKHSQHPLGNAADIEIPGLGQREMYQAALQIPEFANGGIGLYDRGSFIHVDVREGAARWSRVSGKYVGIDEVLKLEKAKDLLAGIAQLRSQAGY